MANKAYDEAAVQAIAAAIRAKNGSADTYKIAQMAAAIADIPTGGTDERFDKLFLKTLEDLDLSSVPGSTRYRVDVPGYLFNVKGVVPRLKSIKTNPYTTTINNNAFAECKSLKTAELNEGLTTIGDYAFQQCTELELSALPSTVTTIGKQAFYGCEKVTLSSPPSALTSAGESAFARSGVTFNSITLTQFGSYIFQGCDGLTNVFCDIRATSNQGTYIFRECVNLKEVKARIFTGGYTFDGCTGLEKIKFLGSTDTALPAKIRTNECQGCKSLTKVWIGSGCNVDFPSWASYLAPFFGCTALTDIYCEEAEQPSSWPSSWNTITGSVTATVHWGVSEAEFDAIVNA